jgi:DNA polymerase-3 subunit delta'
MTAVPEPFARARIIGRTALEAQLRAQISAGAISNGWIIAGPKGAGKATLAYRMARAILDFAALTRGESLDMSDQARTFRQIAARGHPDLFVAARLFDDKNDRYATEITVETIRELSAFLNKTAAGGGWRVAIVDCADDLNRNAANALLKSLEEPPQKAALFLLANEPGRLLATIRSRCRRIDLRPLEEADLLTLLKSELGLEGPRARLIATAAKGRPGQALSLAAGDGAEAISLAQEFLEATAAGRDGAGFASRFSSKALAGAFDIFLETLDQKLADAARARARLEEVAGPFGAHHPGEIVEMRARITALVRRAEALNVDRGQLLFALGREIARAEARAPC